METTPQSADNVGLASALTALNVVVASGFSIAGLIKPELVLPTGATPTDASAIFAMYAAARTIPLALMTLVAIYWRSASTLLVLGLLAGKDVLVGAIDVATDKVETPREVAATLRAALAFVPANRLQACTNCGMVPLSRDLARAKLEALAAGAALVRSELSS